MQKSSLQSNLPRIVLLVVCLALCLTGTVPAPAEVQEEIVIGMKREALDQWLNSAGIDPDYVSEDEVVFCSDDYSCVVTFDSDTNTADWINLTQEGALQSDMDFTVPDFTLTYADIMVQLTASRIAYDLYLSPDSVSLFFDAYAFKMPVTAFLTFPNGGTLSEVMIEEYETAGTIPWAAYMTAALGLPSGYTPLTEYNAGVEKNLHEGMTWTNAKANYVLEHALSIYSFATETGADCVYESDITVTITPR